MSDCLILEPLKIQFNADRATRTLRGPVAKHDKRLSVSPSLAPKVQNGKRLQILFKVKSANHVTLPF